jgi:hypothetical protein
MENFTLTPKICYEAGGPSERCGDCENEGDVCSCKGEEIPLTRPADGWFSERAPEAAYVKPKSPFPSSGVLTFGSNRAESEIIIPEGPDDDLTREKASSPVEDDSIRIALRNLVKGFRWERKEGA